MIYICSETNFNGLLKNRLPYKIKGQISALRHLPVQQTKSYVVIYSIGYKYIPINLSGRVSSYWY